MGKEGTLRNLTFSQNYITNQMHSPLTSYLCKPEHTMSELNRIVIRILISLPSASFNVFFISVLIVCSGLHKYDVK